MSNSVEQLAKLPRAMRDAAHAQIIRDNAIARRTLAKSASTSATQQASGEPTLALESPKARKRPKTLPRPKSPLAVKFELLWRAIAPDIALETEVRVVPDRNFRYDFAVEVGAWARVAVEIEGLIYQDGGGRHQRSKGFESDCLKYFFGTLNGDRIFRLSPKLITPDNITAIANFIRART